MLVGLTNWFFWGRQDLHKVRSVFVGVGVYEGANVGGVEEGAGFHCGGFKGFLLDLGVGVTTTLGLRSFLCGYLNSG